MTLVKVIEWNERNTFDKVPKNIVDCVFVKKPPKEWNECETRKTSFDLKARNISLHVV